MDNYINGKIISVLLNVQILVKYGQMKAKIAHQNVLQMKNIHMKFLQICNITATPNIMKYNSIDVHL